MGTVHIMSLTNHESNQQRNSHWVNNTSSSPTPNPPAYNYGTAPVFNNFPAPPPTYDGKQRPNPTTQTQTVLTQRRFSTMHINSNNLTHNDVDTIGLSPMVLSPMVLSPMVDTMPARTGQPVPVGRSESWR